MTLASSYNPAFITANGGTVGSAFQAFFDSMSDNNAGKRAYLNIHSSFRSGGEIRGFYSVVPEPTSAMLALVGLGLPVLLRRTR
jgi:MYXO-CTERM domain-containing protein